MIAVALAAALPVIPALAGLGEPEASVLTHANRIGWKRHVDARPTYAVHDMNAPDGSRIRQFVNAEGVVFAVRWNTHGKPDLTSVLGPSYPAYRAAAQERARSAGLQRNFRHEQADLVVQAQGHLHVFSGFAFRPSLFPRGLNPQQLSLE